MSRLNCDPMEKNSKMSGYLKRKGKLTITGKWKKWWYVLDGHLLLYYKSKGHYLNKLSPCRGCLNVASARKIQPQNKCQIHIVIHARLIVLRAPSKEKQEDWFNALVNVLQFELTSPFEHIQEQTKTLGQRNDNGDCKNNIRSLKSLSQRSHYGIDSDNNTTSSQKLEIRKSVSETNIYTGKLDSRKIGSRRASFAYLIHSSSHRDNFSNNNRSLTCGYIHTSKNRLMQKSNLELGGCEENVFCDHNTSIFFKTKYNNSKGKIEIGSKIDEYQAFSSETSNVSESNNLMEPTINYLKEQIHSMERLTIVAENEDAAEREESIFTSCNRESKTELKRTPLPMKSILGDSPVLPAKEKINTTTYSTKIARMNSNIHDLQSMKNENSSCSELDSLLHELDTLNSQEVQNYDINGNNEDDEPDYDFPVPYASLVDKTLSNRREITKPTLENLSDFKCGHLLSMDITPDSLEIPWILGLSQENFRTSSLHDVDSDSNVFIDSLNTSSVCS